MSGLIKNWKSYKRTKIKDIYNVNDRNSSPWLKPKGFPSSKNMNTPIENRSVVSLTPKAAAQIKSMISSQPENAGKTLRVYVEGGGCSGMQYGLVFDEKRDDDDVTEFDGVTVLVDLFSANYLRGTVIDFSDSLNAGGFKISNPNAQSSCGCGKSFES